MSVSSAQPVVATRNGLASSSGPSLEGPEILRVDNVTVSFSGFKALNNLTFAIRSGELRVMIGPNGAGKTTLLDVITGKVSPSAGRVHFKGRDITGLPQPTIARLGIGRKFQTPNVFKSLTVLENLMLPVKAGAASGLAWLLLSDRAPGLGSTKPSVWRQKPIDRPACWPTAKSSGWNWAWSWFRIPSCSCIDEPVAGMTPRESERTGELLKAMARKHALLVIEHDMTFVRQIATTITVLDEGQTLFEGTADEVHNNPKVIEVYLGQDKEAACSALTT